MYKCNSCSKLLQKKNEKSIYLLNLPKELLKYITTYVEPNAYSINIVNDEKQYYCDVCYKIGLYQFNKNEQFKVYYKKMFYNRKRFYGEFVLEEEDIYEIQNEILNSWRFERSMNVIPFLIPFLKKYILYFKERFVGGFGSEYKERKIDEKNFAFEWIKNKNIPKGLILD